LVLSSPNPSRLSTPSPARDVPPVCVSVQMQPEVRLAGPGAPVLGARGVLAVPCPPTGAAQVSVVRVGVAVRQVVEGSG